MRLNTIDKIHIKSYSILIMQKYNKKQLKVVGSKTDKLCLKANLGIKLFPKRLVFIVVNFVYKYLVYQDVSSI